MKYRKLTNEEQNEIECNISFIFDFHTKFKKIIYNEYNRIRHNYDYYYNNLGKLNKYFTYKLCDYEVLRILVSGHTHIRDTDGEIEVCYTRFDYPNSISYKKAEKFEIETGISGHDIRKYLTIYNELYKSVTNFDEVLYKLRKFKSHIEFSIIPIELDENDVDLILNLRKIVKCCNDNLEIIK